MKSLPHLDATRPWLALSLVVFGPWCAFAVARQELPEEPSGYDRIRIERLLAERERGAMHPSSEPTRLVGREQDGNDLRSKTPALINSDRLQHAVDPDELRQRTLAMYEEGASFHLPLANTAPLSPVERKRVQNAVKPEEVEGMQTGLGFWTVTAMLLGLAGLWVYQSVPRAQGGRSA